MSHEVLQIASYRLQLHRGFGFAEAGAVIGYLQSLGVSDLYTSPCLQATAGSTHGYDVVDPTRVNEELGGEAGRRRLVESLQAAQIGWIPDIVPNHMAASAVENRWFRDVLTHGPESVHAATFDIDWSTGRVLLPVLGDHYGRVLERGELHPEVQAGTLVIRYFDRHFPVDPASIRPAPGESLDALAERLTGDTDVLDALLQAQHYRLAYWRVAGEQIGYRRFFDINELIGVRVEDSEVFARTHALPIAWAAEGCVRGLRVDHPDGLRNPRQYFQQLHEACPGVRIVAEKILEGDELLPQDWPVAGTTGYEFLNRAGGLFVDPEGEQPLTRLYEEVTGCADGYPAVLHRCKRMVLEDLFAGEVDRLAGLFAGVCATDRLYRDYTPRQLREAVVALAAALPVYRTYVEADQVPASGAQSTEADRLAIEEAVTGTDAGDSRRPLVRFLADRLLQPTESPEARELVMRFQQLTGPAMAKGAEDTAFYRYHRLTCLNEVGGNPGQFGIPVARFHDACRMTQERYPTTMLAGTTHDTKRSEDVRARLALLSVIPDSWRAAVLDWRRMNARHRSGGLPDPNAEYLLYQTLVGAWPIDAERLTAYMVKASREAKVHTSWLDPDGDYEEVLERFVRGILADTGFVGALRRFVEPLVAPGRVNGLAQTLLRLTVPGVPDLYQGAELWDHSLVDPDNRRPVDFDRRMKLLSDLEGLSPEEAAALALRRADDGLPKLWLIRQTLAVRRRLPGAFGPGAAGAYEPLTPSGREAHRLVAFCRGGDVVVLVPRLALGLRDGWGDTTVDLPVGPWLDALTGRRQDGGPTLATEIFARFPVAVLHRIP